MYSLKYVPPIILKSFCSTIHTNHTDYTALELQILYKNEEEVKNTVTA